MLFILTGWELIEDNGLSGDWGSLGVSKDHKVQIEIKKSSPVPRSGLGSSCRCKVPSNKLHQSWNRKIFAFIQFWFHLISWSHFIKPCPFQWLEPQVVSPKAERKKIKKIRKLFSCKYLGTTWVSRHGPISHDICQTLYTSGFWGQNFYTVKVRNTALFTHDLTAYMHWI